MEKKIEFDAFWFPGLTDFNKNKGSIVFFRDFKGFFGDKYGQEKVHVTLSPACPECSSQEPDYKAILGEMQCLAQEERLRGISNWHLFNKQMEKLFKKHTPSGFIVARLSLQGDPTGVKKEGT